MMMPRIFKNEENDLFSNVFSPVFANRMLTDVKELDDRFELDIELPGMNKEDIELYLKSGYLTISARKEENKDEKDSEGKIIRQERSFGSMSRSFYVGESVTEKDIAAKYENGVLHLVVPKKEVPEKLIEIE